MSPGFLDVGSMRETADVGKRIHVSSAFKPAISSMVDNRTWVANGSRKSTPRQLPQFSVMPTRNSFASPSDFSAAGRYKEVFPVIMS